MLRVELRHPHARLEDRSSRVTGRGIWGEPENRPEAVTTLRRLPELGLNFIDTAESYGPETSEKLISEALHPYPDLIIATKGGLKRPGLDNWVPHAGPAYLIGQAMRSRDLLGVKPIDLWQLHRIDPNVPKDEQFGAIRELIDTGVIRYAGLSEVSVADIKAAQKVFPVATVQNRCKLADRASEDVLTFCEKNNIGFIPWYPLAAGDLARPVGNLDTIAKRHKATPGQVALTWTLKRSPMMLPIPGTSKVAHLEKYVAAAALDLSQDEFNALS